MNFLPRWEPLRRFRPRPRCLLRLAAGAQKVNVAVYIALEAKPGKEEAVAEFLRQGKAFAEAEPATIAWFGVRLGPSTFAIFDAFPDDAGRQAHMSGKIAAALMEKAGDLLAQPPSIKMADILASKLPG